VGPHHVYGYRLGQRLDGPAELLGTYATVEAARAEAATQRLLLPRTFVASISAETGRLRVTWEPPAPLW
jgi:hypothetical protein